MSNKLKIFRESFLILMACLCVSCERVEEPTAGDSYPSWESMAEGYVEENASPVFGSSKYTHLRESTADGQLYDFVLQVGPLTDVSDANAAVKNFWGWGFDDKEYPEAVWAARHVLKMSLAVDGKKVKIPEAAYVDLIDLRVDRSKRLLWRDESRFMLYLEGSDAGESYRLKFTIENTKVIKREVWAGEFPEMGNHEQVFE